jgi:hypothetical protein
MDCNSQEMCYWILAGHPNGTAPSLRRILHPLLPLPVHHPGSRRLRPSSSCVQLQSRQPGIEPAPRTAHRPHQPRSPRPMRGKYQPSNAMNRRTVSSMRKWAPQGASAGTRPSQVRDSHTAEVTLNNLIPLLTLTVLLFKRLIDWVSERFTRSMTNDLTDNLLTDRTINLLKDRLIYWQTERMTLTDRPTEQLTYWKIDRFTDRPNEWHLLTDWQTDDTTTIRTNLGFTDLRMD